MIDLDGMISIPYLKKTTFTGSHLGMNFMIRKISGEEGDKMQAVVWPGPFIFSVTEDEKKTFHLGEPKTYSSIRTVPINNICEAALLSQIRIHKIIYERSPYKPTLQFPNLLFTTKYCTPLNSVLYSAAIDKIVDEINLMRDSLDQMERFSGHTFRHTFATRCFEAGIEPKTVQSFLGHATLQMTMDLYTSVMPRKKKSDMDKLESTIDIEAPDISEFKQADNDRKIIHLCS